MKTVNRIAWLVFAGIAVFLQASEHEEFRIKRENVFEFGRKPEIVRKGDTVTISFVTKGFCDVSVAVENSQGKIVRHLASGVLGPNAPAPFKKNSKAQTIIWDGKDDQGRYVTESEKGYDDIYVRVSLGLKPRFEKTLFWSPYKRLTIGKAIDADAIRICPAPEGVYVSDGTGVDSIRLFDHKGNYEKTVYPFPADRLKDVKGLNLMEFPQTGQKLPLGNGMMHATLLTCGSSSDRGNKYGYAAQFIASRGDRIAIGFYKLNRLSSDGSTGGLPLEGPEIFQTVKIGPEDMWSKGTKKKAGPRSAVFSQDGKYLFLSGYGWTGVLGRAHEWLNCVTRLEFSSDKKPELFAGSMKQGDYGSGPGQFKWAVSVALDAQGRVYAADHLNSRIQVFSPEGKFIKAIPVERPAFVGVHHTTGEIYVLSWRLGSEDPKLSPFFNKPIYTRFGPLARPEVKASYPLKVLKEYNYGRGISSRLIGGGMQYVAALDSWADEPVIWLAPGKGEPLMMIAERKGKLEVIRDFKQDVIQTVVRTIAPIIQRQRLYVNPANGRLYVGEGDSGVMKSFMQLVEIDPESGNVKLVDIPFGAEDLCIDLNGLFYLRTDITVGRFDPATWREVPWDYGEEREKVSFGQSDGYPGMRGNPVADLTSGLMLPAVGRPANWHMGGMAISPKGHLAVTCYNTATKTKVLSTTAPQGTPEGDAKRGLQGVVREQKYIPRLYPGRAINWETHIWDKYGKLILQDATPGLTKSDGIGIDKDDNIYFLSSFNRALGGKAYPISTAGTLIKVCPGNTKVVSPGKGPGVPIPVSRETAPSRERDFAYGGWAEKAAWMYGGIGLNNMPCICWNARPALDLYARSFAPEINHFSVAVLDTNGNLIIRIGRYGNIDDGIPARNAERGTRNAEKPNQRSIGKDEVALAFAPYLATHTDRRLFIADPGNSRIVSVKLGYHAEEKIKLGQER